MDARRGCSRQVCVFPLEQIHKFTIAPGDLGNGLIACRLFAAPSDQRIPEHGATDGESDVTRHRRRDAQPFADFAIVLAATENDAADGVSHTRTGCRHDALAILAPIEPFKLPVIRFHPPILKFPNGFDHQARPQLKIIDPLVAGQPVELVVDSFRKQTLHGHVDSLSPASGLEFALLPPDNATGNFTKIVQRVPVKIVLDDQSLKGLLRPGMSAVPTVNTKATVVAERETEKRLASRGASPRS